MEGNKVTKRKAKDRLYHFFVEKNRYIRQEYETYVEDHLEEHKERRRKHWWLLLRLNWHYRIMRKNTPLIADSKVKIGKNASQGKKAIPSDQIIGETKKERFWFVHEIWNTVGATDELIEMLKLWEQSWWSWKNNNPAVFLIYICCLLERGNKEEAKRVLNKYICNIGKKDICKYMPVSDLFVEMGYRDFLIERSAFVFRQLEKNRNERVLENLLSGKRVAVVGNGPTEIGKKRGTEIDNHDIVIRFNNYQTDGFEEDYGLKTDIWVRNGNILTEDRDIVEEISMVLWEPDYWHMHIQHNHLDLLYRDIRMMKTHVSYMYGIRSEICSRSNVLNPTTGAQIVYYIEKNKHILRELDYYGFSFLNETSDASYEHYYNEATTAQKIHQPKIEMEFLRSLVCKSNRESTSENERLSETILGKKQHKVYACAFREYSVKKGKTGGPAGVLAMQKQLLGNSYKNVPIQYLFLPTKITYSKEVLEQCEQVSGKVKSILQGAYFIQNHIQIRKDLEEGVVPVLMCHDIGTAYGAFLRGLKYILIYHQQGSIRNEMEAVGAQPSPKEIDILNKIEKRVLENAENVYFPSIGAKNVLMNTSEIAGNSGNIAYAEYPLYNTIPDIPEDGIDYSLLKELGIPEINKKETDIFFSCGDYNFDKGMELIPEFLNEYARSSSKKVYWIAIGSAGTYDIYEKLCEKKNGWNFNCTLIGKRTSHNALLTLMEYSDYYLMLHRNSIFDLATLEAMRAGKPLILSPVGGNIEFNVCDNVVFVESNKYEAAVKEIMNRDYLAWKESNLSAFNEYFSHEKFTEKYKLAMDELLKKNGFTSRILSEKNNEWLTPWKDRFKGKRVVICGAGESLDDYVAHEGAMHIALNRALFFPKIKFDFSFMQDYPQNQPYSIDDYNKYPCTKFYGIITNPRTTKIGLYKEYYADEVVGDIVNYELAPAWYERYVDDLNFNLDKECVVDAQSVAFSAIQFAVFAGFSEIILYGIEFSGTNQGGTNNLNKYAASVEGNLITFKKVIKEKYPNIIFRFGSTHNEKLRKAFEKIDSGEKKYTY